MGIFTFRNVNFEELVPALIEHPNLIYYLDGENLISLLEDPDAVDLQEGDQIVCVPYTDDQGRDGLYLQVESPYEDSDGNVSYLPLPFDPRMVILF